MTILIVMVLIGLIPATVARGKGREFALWWVYGSLLFIVALPHALLLKPDLQGQGMKTCPRCAEPVKEAAAVCRYCGHEFPTPSDVSVGGIVLAEGDQIDAALDATFRRKPKREAIDAN